MVLAVLRSKKFTRRVLIALLIIIVPAFVLWGAGSLTQGPEIVGTIGREKITVNDFEKSRQGIRMQVIFSYYSDPEAMNTILKNREMINLMAWERLIMLAAAENKRIKIDNKLVVDFIATHPLFQKDGVFNKDVYDRILRSALTIDPREFEELVRENLQVKSLRQDLLRDIDVTGEEILEEYKRTNDSVDLSYLVIDGSLFPGKIDITDREIEVFYEKNRADFMTSPEVIVEYIEIPYMSPGERTAGAKKLEQIYPELVSGGPASFAGTAAKHGLSYNKTGPFAVQDVVLGVDTFAEFQRTAFLLRSGEISQPLYSGRDRGKIYLLRKLEDIPEEQKPLESVKEEIRGILTAERYLDMSREKAAELYSEIITSASSLEDVSSRIRRGIKRTGPVTLEGYIEDVGPAGKIVQAARKSGEGSFLEPVSTLKGSVIIRVEEILPADETGLETAKEDIRAGLLSRKQTKLLQNWFMSQNAKINLKKNLGEL